jgi:putative cell wall-binding protein
VTAGNQGIQGARKRSPLRVLTAIAAVTVAASLLVATAPAAQATVLEPLTLEQLTQRASTIVIAKTAQTVTRLGRLGAAGTATAALEAPQTLVGLEVVDVLKGSVQAGPAAAGAAGAAADATTAVPVPALADPSIDLIVPVWGGTVGDRTLEVDGMPAFSPGETCIVFLDGSGRVIGGMQGKLNVSDGVVTGTDAVGVSAEPLASVRARIAAAATDGALSAESALDPTASSDAVGGVTPQAAAAATPVITNITPGSAPAGTGDRVTITGTGFGSTAGSVKFFYRTGQPLISAPVVSWSDTSIVVEVPVAVINGYWATASSGPVTVTNAAGSTSAGYQFYVTFSYGQVEWFWSAVSFRVNANCADTTQERAMIDAAAASWSAPADFGFSDTGTCTTTSPNSNDGYCDLFWSSTLLPSGVIATSWTVYWNDSILETDICFNDLYAWGDGSNSTMDVQTITLHEMGHWLKLRDLYGTADQGKAMYGYRSIGTVQRELSEGDRDGIIWIYGQSGTPLVKVGDDATVYLGSPFTRAGSFSDPDADTWTATVDYGDGGGAQTLALNTDKTFSLSHLYAQRGTYTVTVTVTDSTGESGSDTLDVLVTRIPPNYVYLRGSDRYQTAILISRAGFPNALPPGSGLVLAPGETFQEALCGAPLAAAYGGPVLLTTAEGLNRDVRDEIIRLAPQYVFCIGLSDTIGAAVRTALGSNATVTVIRGTLGNTYDMSRRVANALADKVGDMSQAVAIVTRGDMFPDAIGVSPLVCAQRWPILLTEGISGPLNSSSAAALAELGMTKVIKVGTYVSLPTGVTSLTNLSGADRYQTNRNVAEWGVKNADLAFTHIGLATGDKFPDALAAGPYLARDRGILLLTPLNGPLPDCIGAEISAYVDEIDQVSFIAMIEPVLSQVKALLQ